jgi:hypothetical protein
MLMAITNLSHRNAKAIPDSIHQLYGMLLVDSCPPLYRSSHILWHTSSKSCCFQLYIPLLTLPSGSYYQWMQWQRCGGLPSVSVVTVSHKVAPWKKYLFSTRFWSAHTLQRCLWCHCLLTWKRRGKWQLKDVGSPEEYMVKVISKWNM